MEATIQDSLKKPLEDFAGSGLHPQPHKAQKSVVALGSTAALTIRPIVDDSDLVVIATADNTVITLPAAAAATKGHRLRVVYHGADGGAKVSVSPAAADKIYGSVVGVTGAGGATVVASGGVDDKDWIMTKATINDGDYVDLLCDGVDGWAIIGGVGEQASE